MYQSGLYSHFMATKLGVEGDHKKDLDTLAPINNKPLDIDEEAAMLSVNQIINNKMENLEKFDKKKDEKLDLSSVDQGRLGVHTFNQTSANGWSSNLTHLKLKICLKLELKPRVAPDPKV